MTTVKDARSPGLHLHKFWQFNSFVFSTFKDHFGKLLEILMIDPDDGNPDKSLFLVFYIYLKHHVIQFSLTLNNAYLCHALTINSSFSETNFFSLNFYKRPCMKLHTFKNNIYCAVAFS